MRTAIDVIPLCAWLGLTFFACTNKDEQFIKAIHSGQIAIVQQMLLEGQDPDTFYPLHSSFQKTFGIKKPEKKSVLFFALDEHQEEIALLLIEFGCDPNIEDQTGHTPLFLCAQWDYLSVAKALIANGANFAHKNTIGNTVLHQSAFSPGAKCMEFFIKLAQDVDPNLLNERNKYGKTPTSYAIEGKNKVAEDLLQVAIKKKHNK